MWYSKIKSEPQTPQDATNFARAVTWMHFLQLRLDLSNGLPLELSVFRSITASHLARANDS